MLRISTKKDIKIWTYEAIRFLSYDNKTYIRVEDIQQLLGNLQDDLEKGK